MGVHGPAAGLYLVSHGPGFIHSGSDKKKEVRSEMEKIQEGEEPPHPKDMTPSPSSPVPPSTPQTPQQQRPAQSTDTSKGQAPLKRFHFHSSTEFELTFCWHSSDPPPLCLCTLTLPYFRSHGPPLLQPHLDHLVITGAPVWLS